MGHVKPAVCGVCGCAVVRPTKMPPRTGELNGHKYENDRLVRVRCKAHGGLGWVDLLTGEPIFDPLDPGCF